MSPEQLNQVLELSTTALIVGLALSVVFAAICGFLAARRGRSWVFWSAMGFAFGPLALPFVFVGKKKHSTDEPAAPVKPR